MEKTSKLDNLYRKDWLAVAQNDMANVKKIRLASDLVCKLYSLMKKCSKRDDGHWDIYDEDAIAFAKAYKDAMVRRYCNLFSKVERLTLSCPSAIYQGCSKTRWKNLSA